MGTQLPPEQRAHPLPPSFLAHVYYGQTAGWMKTPLGTEVDLGLGHIVLDGVPALREIGKAAPRRHLFGPCLLWPWSPVLATAELLFQDGGRPPSWICYVSVRTIHEGHLVVFIAVQNLVGIDSVLLIICMFFDFTSLA